MSTHDYSIPISRFQEKKEKSILLADSFERLRMEGRALRCRCCGDDLDFQRQDGGRWALVAANFCRERLCPMCSWRRSRKIYGVTSQILDYLDEHPPQSGPYRYLFLTLTVQNVKPDALQATFSSMQEAWQRLRHDRTFEHSILGGMKTVEVTYNDRDYVHEHTLKHGDQEHSFQVNYWKDTYHPHFHVVLAVSQNYFRRDCDEYILHSEWTALWKRALRVDYTPVVWINAISGRFGDRSAVAEVSKYAAKDSDYILFENEAETDSRVETLQAALGGRRLVSWFGCMKEAKRAIGDPDPENDLVDKLRSDLRLCIQRYHWFDAFGGYGLLDGDFRDVLERRQRHGQFVPLEDDEVVPDMDPRYFGDRDLMRFEKFLQVDHDDIDVYLAHDVKPSLDLLFSDLPDSSDMAFPEITAPFEDFFPFDVEQDE